MGSAGSPSGRIQAAAVGGTGAYSGQQTRIDGVMSAARATGRFLPNSSAATMAAPASETLFWELRMFVNIPYMCSNVNVFDRRYDIDALIDCSY